MSQRPWPGASSEQSHDTQLRVIRRAWTRFGRVDPLWAVLVEPGKEHGRWSVEEFFRSGDQEIETALARATQQGFAVARTRALDFGCGVGRLSQALAARFERTDGVDISRTMLSWANQYNKFPERCVYHLNERPDLSIFPDASFTLVCSSQVLQHMPPTLAKSYLREFVRLLAPGGFLVFQLPSHRSPVAPPRDAPRTMATDRLPRGAFNARVACDTASIRARAGEPVTLTVTVRNLSRHTWPSLGRPDRKFHLFVGNRWRDQDGRLVSEDARAPLPFDIGPGEEATLFLAIHPPEANGLYRVEIDLVQEMVGWFQNHGSNTATVLCTIEGGSDAPVRPLHDQPADRPRFRERHPRLYPIMTAVGLKAANEAWQRSRVALSDLWDDLRLHSGWRRGLREMEMHCIPSSEIQELLESHGARLVDLQTELVRDGFQSCRYLVVRES